MNSKSKSKFIKSIKQTLGIDYDGSFISGLYCNQFHGLAAPWSQASSKKATLKPLSITFSLLKLSSKGFEIKRFVILKEFAFKEVVKITFINRIE